MAGRQNTLLDPDCLALWARYQEVVAQGIRTLRQWGPADGLPFSPSPPAHEHTMPTLALSLSGSVRIQGKHDIDLVAGDLLLIEPGCWHTHLPHRPDSSSFALGFLAGRCDILFFNHKATLWGAVHEQPYHDLVSALMDEKREAERLNLVDQILQQVCKDRIDFVDWIEPGVLQMAAYLWNHLHENFDVDEMVARCGHGRTTGFRLFKTFFGRSPKQELLAQRVDLARHLLKRGFPVAQVATRAGFSSRAELTRAFRQRLGHPPSDEIPLDAASSSAAG